MKISDHWIFSKRLKNVFFCQEVRKFHGPFNSQGKAKTPPHRADEATNGFNSLYRSGANPA